MRRHLLLLVLFTLAAAPALAQQHPNQARGFAADRVYQGLGGIDTVNTFNGNLSLTIGFPSFPAGGPLSYTVGPLTYNSNVWEFEPVIRLGQERTFAYPVNTSNAGLGWTFGLGRLLSPTEAGSAYWVYLTPDGAERSFRDRLHNETPVAGVRYTHDSSYLRLRELNPGSPTTGRELDFPDGTTHHFDAAGKLTSIRDRFDNEMTVTQTDTLWTIEDPWRTHTIEFTLMNYDGVQKPMVTKVTLTAFGSGETAEWTFRYAENESVNRSCGDDDIQSSAAVIVPLLIGIDLPDGSSYEMPAEHYNRTAACSAEVSPRGMLSRLQLPTLGRIEWTYGRYQMSDERVRDMAIGVTERKLVSATGAALGTWLYASQRGPNMNQLLLLASPPTVTRPPRSRNRMDRARSITSRSSGSALLPIIRDGRATSTAYRSPITSTMETHHSGCSPRKR